MRLDQAGGDLQVGPDVPAVDPAGNPPRGRADQRVLFQACAEMVLDAIAGHDLLAEHLELLGVGAGPVQAGRDQDQRLLAGNAGLLQDLEHRPQDRLVGDRPRDVADQDAGVFPPLGDLAQGGRADRLFQRRGDRRLGVRQRRHVANRQRPDDPLRGQLHVQSRPAVVQCELQGFFMVLDRSRALDRMSS